jgi:hypothetical protein
MLPWYETKKNTKENMRQGAIALTGIAMALCTKQHRRPIARMPCVEMWMDISIKKIFSQQQVVGENRAGDVFVLFGFGGSSDAIATSYIVDDRSKS